MNDIDHTPEKPKKKQTSPLDDVHAAPYADYAARILDGMATEQGSNSLSAVLQGPEKLKGIDAFTEAEVNEQIQLFTDQFDDAQKELFDEKNTYFLDALQAIYDEEKQTFVIGDEGGALIEQLHLGNMALAELYIPPALKSLQKLTCNNNQLSTLPVLPQSLTYLDCCFNPLGELPELPSQLSDLLCAFNQLTLLPKLPLPLVNFDCSGNQLTLLPKLPPHLEVLHCDANELTTLPEIPQTLIHINFRNNPLDQQTHDILKRRGLA